MGGRRPDAELMPKPRCTACKLSNVDALDAELEAGLPLRQAAAAYGITTTVLHRHRHAHLGLRGASYRPPRQRVLVDDAREPPTVPERLGDHPIEPTTALNAITDRLEIIDPDVHHGAEVGTADKPRTPPWLRRLSQRRGNVRNQDLDKAIEEADKLASYVKDLAAPIRDLCPPGVVVHEARPGLFQEFYAAPWFDKPGRQDDGF